MADLDFHRKDDLHLRHILVIGKHPDELSIFPGISLSEDLV